MSLNDERARAAERYRPETVRLLLVAQTPPVSAPHDAPRYFYFDHVTKHDHLFRAVVWTGLGARPNRGGKAALLSRLRDDGTFLIDLKPDPSDRRPLAEFVPSLLDRCKVLRPERMILIKTDVYDAAFGRLRAAGLPAVDARIPFPGSGRQKEFAEKFANALVEARVGRSGLPVPVPPCAGERPLYPLAPEHGLYLFPHAHGNDARFALLFGRVWRQMHPRDRDAIVAHWRQCKWVSQDEGRVHLTIALENLSRMRRDQAIGNCAAKGTDLTFYARVVDLLPDDLVMYIIAHELAHVLQVSRGQRLRPDAHPLGDAVAYLVNPVEREADEIALGWGFGGAGLQRWLSDHLDWDGLPPDPY